MDIRQHHAGLLLWTNGLARHRIETAGKNAVLLADISFPPGRSASRDFSYLAKEAAEMIKVAFFDAKAYDKPSFEHYGSLHDIRFKYLETKLNEDTVDLAKGCSAVCVFVNDTVNSAVISKLYEYGVRLIALRSAGYNNVDLQAAFGKIHVVHVPAYSPYAVAEHAIALLLTSVRRIHKAYNRTRDFNFSLNGLAGFDFTEKPSA